MFERCIFPQISTLMDPYQAKQQCGFRKGYSSQYYMLEKM